MVSSFLVVAAGLGFKALVLTYVWLLGCVISAELSRSKGYGEKPGLGTGLILSALAVPIWFAVPPKDNLAEWHTRKPTYAMYAIAPLIVGIIVVIVA